MEEDSIEIVLNGYRKRGLTDLLDDKVDLTEGRMDSRHSEREVEEWKSSGYQKIEVSDSESSHQPGHPLRKQPSRSLSDQNEVLAFALQSNH